MPTMQATQQDIKAQVRAYIVDNFIMGGNADHLKDADSFMETHVVDSTGFLELVTFIEETYQVTVSDDDMVPENLDSLDNIDAYVRRKLAAG
jgi:acyl carrier protein